MSALLSLKLSLGTAPRDVQNDLFLVYVMEYLLKPRALCNHIYSSEPQHLQHGHDPSSTGSWWFGRSDTSWGVCSGPAIAPGSSAHLLTGTLYPYMQAGIMTLLLFAKYLGIYKQTAQAVRPF